jgi:hypothetical protein
MENSKTINLAPIFDDMRFDSDEIKVMYHIIRALEATGDKKRSRRRFDRAVKTAAKSANHDLLLLASTAALLYHKAGEIR